MGPSLGSAAVDDSFYVPLGDDRYRATVHTTGPWDARSQHGGPPSALLGRALERCEPRDDTVVARVTVELLGPVPVGELDLRVRVARPGRSVELLEAALSAGGRDCARASAWRVRRTDAPAVPPRAAPPPPLPPAAPPLRRGGWVDGYLSAVEWRPVAGRLRRARPGDGLDPAAPPAGPGRGAEPAAAGAGRRRQRQRRLAASSTWPAGTSSTRS